MTAGTSAALAQRPADVAIADDTDRAIDADAAPLFVVLGNPNVGKTTLFNRLTGKNARVGNYAGVTVERRPGTLRLGTGADTLDVELLDLPGCYSLSARSGEEQIAINAA